jgi:hypothetical protein
MTTMMILLLTINITHAEIVIHRLQGYFSNLTQTEERPDDFKLVAMEACQVKMLNSPYKNSWYLLRIQRMANTAPYLYRLMVLTDKQQGEIEINSYDVDVDVNFCRNHEHILDWNLDIKDYRCTLEIQQDGQDYAGESTCISNCWMHAFNIHTIYVFEDYFTHQMLGLDQEGNYKQIWAGAYIFEKISLVDYESLTVVTKQNACN